MDKRAIFTIGALSAAIVAGVWQFAPAPPQPAQAATMAAAPIAIGAQAAARAPISLGQSPLVLELFTSQGCSSCPPADALVGRIARSRSDILVISRPVTYWDRLGWRDTLAKEENTDLQRAYAARGLAGRNGVYTPQAVIDGRGGTVGSSPNQIEALVEQAVPHRQSAPELTLSNDGKVTVSGGARKAAQLSLVALDSQESVSIALGENRNRTITYTNLLVKEQQLGTWRGGEAEFALPANYRSTRGADRFALILREGTAGPILAARRL